MIYNSWGNVPIIYMFCWIFFFLIFFKVNKCNLNVGHSWGQIWCPKNMPKTHMNKQRKWNYFPFGLSQELGAAFNYLDKEIRKRWACCGLNIWSLNYYFVVIICIYGKTQFQFVFGKESKWQKQVFFVVLKTHKKRWFSWKNQWFYDWFYHCFD